MRYRVLMITVLLVLLGTALPVSSGPSERPSGQFAAEQDVRDLVSRYAAALRAGNAAGLAVDVTQEAVEMPPNAPALVGREVIEQAYDDLFELASYEEFQLEVEELIPMGDWAFVRATYALVLMSKIEVGAPIEDAGKFVLLAARQPDGSWQAARIIYNSDFPG